MSLAEVLVRPGENPAFRVLRQVQKHKAANSRESLTAAEFESYSRTEVSLADLPKSLAKRKVVKDIRALAVRRGAAAAADPDAPLPLFASEVGSKVIRNSGRCAAAKTLPTAKCGGLARAKARCCRKCWGPTS